MRALIAALLVLASLPAAADALRPFQRGTWQMLRQAHVGRPLIVHFWGITCGPCIAELPRWGSFARERPDIDLAIVAADPVPMKADALASRLAKAGLSGTDDWVFDGFPERLRFAVDPRWQGDLPRTILIGRDGSVKVITGTADFAEVRAWLDAQRSPG